MRGLFVVAYSIAFAAATLGRPAQAAPSPPEETRPAGTLEGSPPTPPRPILGVGYKSGAGIGSFTSMLRSDCWTVGGDLIVDPVEHFSVDLSGTYIHEGTSDGGANGWAFAPALQYQPYGWPDSTPYVGVGPLYVSMHLNDAQATATGAFVNAGYVWKWDNGLALILGGGVQYLQKITLSVGQTTLEYGGVDVNLEFGLRYMLL